MKGVAVGCTGTLKKRSLRCSISCCCCSKRVRKEREERNEPRREGGVRESSRCGKGAEHCGGLWLYGLPLGPGPLRCSNRTAGAGAGRQVGRLGNAKGRALITNTNTLARPSCPSQCTARPRTERDREGDRATGRAGYPMTQ
ncbi:hypothetical protein Mapa_000721 [Marchantia paleacea]|nr:hypothetical protein Mapa_000721 [Marchantia paleacea]